VIKDGVVIETGPHQQLLDLDGVYADLHRLQFGNALDSRKKPRVSHT